MGHLLSEPEACLAVTGCPGLEDVDLTILSEHAPGTGMFKWYKNGRVENVYPNEKVHTFTDNLVTSLASEFSHQRNRSFL